MKAKSHYKKPNSDARHERTDARRVRSLAPKAEQNSRDAYLANASAAAIQAILTGTQWLTIAQLARRSGIEASVLARRLARWESQRRLFSFTKARSKRYPLYAFDKDYRPLRAMSTILRHVGRVGGLRTAAWFESTTGWLSSKRPRELLASNPKAVIDAAKQYPHQFTIG